MCVRVESNNYQELDNPANGLKKKINVPNVFVQYKQVSSGICLRLFTKAVRQLDHHRSNSLISYWVRPEF